jgi:hypothetical protein
MSSLDKNGEPFIWDYCLGLTSGERTARVEAFIACNKGTVQICTYIQAILRPLASLRPEPCPEELADHTIRRLCALAQRGRCNI